MLRIDRAGGWYNLTARGNERRAIYREDADRRRFCQLLEEMVARFRVRLHAYVLMDNHYHLMAQVRMTGALNTQSFVLKTATAFCAQPFSRPIIRRESN